jgi:23S rRNA pseudouridine1911/1915/1917 synthase
MSTAEPAEEDDGLLSAEVPAAMAGARLDAVCARLFEQYSRSRLQAWIDEGRLRVNGLVVTRARQPVAAADQLELEAVAPQDTRVLAQDLPLDVRYADAAIAVIHKPAGFTVHPGAGQRDGTLQNALLHHFPQTAAVPRAGIVHRLDKDTSGLLVVALALNAHARLVADLAARDFRREYDAVVHGTLVAGGTIDLPIGRHPRDRLRMAVVEGGRGREAVTHYRVQERFPAHTHLRCKLETGRTHQIRVHLAHLRHPIVGDATYGGDVVRGQGMSARLRAALKEFPRQALHARELELAHPLSGKRMGWVAEPPADMQMLIELLRSER